MKWLCRSTVFAAFFAVTGFILAYKGLLTAQYVALVGAVHGFVLARALGDDYHERSMNGNGNGKDKPHAD